MLHVGLRGGAVVIAAGTLALALGATAASQGSKHADAEYLRAAYDTYRTMASTSPYAPIPWQYLGPTNISGRATDIAVADTRSGRRIYAGYATGGVWESDDNGGSWKIDLRRLPVDEHRRSRRRSIQP